MRRGSWPWFGPALILLAGGWLIGQHVLTDLSTDLPAAETFREWLWETRSLDLAVQVGIVFVGALGIAALLPSGDEAQAGDGVRPRRERGPAWLGARARGRFPRSRSYSTAERAQGEMAPGDSRRKAVELVAGEGKDARSDTEEGV